MVVLNASVVPNSTSQLARSELQRVGRQTKTIVNSSLPLLRPLQLQPATFGGKKQSLQMKSAAFICAAALNARMGAQQTQTVESSTRTIAPIQGRETIASMEKSNITNKRKVLIEYNRVTKKIKVLMEETRVRNKRKVSNVNNHVTNKIKVFKEENNVSNKRKVSIENNRVTKKIKLLKEEDYVTENQKVSMEDIIPEELIEEILVRLDVENLIRCKSVCKSWNSLISHRHFIKAHQDHCFNNNDNGHTRIDQVILPYYLWETGHDKYIVGSSNGLVCINSFHGNEFVVANPWTREERMVQKHLASKESCWGFGYDPVTNDYKIVFGVKEGKYQTSFQVLSLKSNVWKHIGHVNGTCPRGELATLCNGALHWIMHHEGQGQGKSSIFSGKSSIISFDLCKEVFKEIPQPDDARYNPDKEDIPREHMMLGIKGERLCIWRTDHADHPNNTWIMQKYNVKESWEPLGGSFQKKFDCIRYSSDDVPDIGSSTYDTWFLKKCMCVPTTTMMPSLVSPYSSGQ